MSFPSGSTTTRPTSLAHGTTHSEKHCAAAPKPSNDKESPAVHDPEALQTHPSTPSRSTSRSLLHWLNEIDTSPKTGNHDVASQLTAVTACDTDPTPYLTSTESSPISQRPEHHRIWDDQQPPHTADSEPSTSATSAPPSPGSASDEQEQPKWIWLTDCVQCVIKNLPCDVGIPACTRCIRAGCGDRCLVQMRMLRRSARAAAEQGAGEEEKILARMPVDDERSWATKVELARELADRAREQQDRRNWVFPTVDSARGRFSARRVAMRDYERGRTNPLQALHEAEASRPPALKIWTI